MPFRENPAREFSLAGTKLGMIGATHCDGFMKAYCVLSERCSRIRSILHCFAPTSRKSTGFLVCARLRYSFGFVFVMVFAQAHAYLQKHSPNPRCKQSLSFCLNMLPSQHLSRPRRTAHASIQTAKRCSQYRLYG